MDAEYVLQEIKKISFDSPPPGLIWPADWKDVQQELQGDYREFATPQPKRRITGYCAREHEPDYHKTKEECEFGPM